MLYNSKWFENFQACSELALKNASKKVPPFCTFFHSMWPCICLVFHKAKKRIFVTSNTNILQSTRWKFLKFFPHLLNLAYYKILRLYVSKTDIFQKFGTYPKNGSLGTFLVIIPIELKSQNDQIFAYSYFYSLLEQNSSSVKSIYCILIWPMQTHQLKIYIFTLFYMIEVLRLLLI